VSVLADYGNLSAGVIQGGWQVRTVTTTVLFLVFGVVSVACNLYFERRKKGRAAAAAATA
jgi:hypothetical protein